MLVELGRSAAAWASRLVFVNGHGGNLPTVPAAVGALRHEGRDVAWFGCAVPGGDAHAGRTETSILLELDPAVVHTGAAQPGNTAPLRELLPALRRGGVTAVSRNGVLGDPTGANAAEGAPPARRDGRAAARRARRLGPGRRRPPLAATAARARAGTASTVPRRRPRRCRRPP